jgi:hypothetical protein
MTILDFTGGANISNIKGQVGKTRILKRRDE